MLLEVDFSSFYFLVLQVYRNKYRFLYGDLVSYNFAELAY